jgi:hypothetical protein
MGDGRKNGSFLFLLARGKEKKRQVRSSKHKRILKQQGAKFQSPHGRDTGLLSWACGLFATGLGLGTLTSGVSFDL